MNKTIKNILYLLFAVFFGKFAGIIKSFYLAKVLQPSSYGIWASLILIIMYAPILSLGTVEALIKKYPYYIGKGELQKAEEIDAGVFGSIVISAMSLLILGMLTTFFIENIDNNVLYLRIVLIVAFVSMFFGYFYNRFIAFQNFKFVSIVDVIRSIAGLICIVIFTSLWGLLGAFIGLLVGEIITIIFSIHMNYNHLGKFIIKIDFKLIKNLIKIGLPITLIWWVFILQNSLDRLVSISMLGSTQTGLYTLGVNIVGVVFLLPRVVARVLYPKINNLMGKNFTAGEFDNLVINPSHLIGFLISLFIGVFFIISPLIYTKYFPNYLPGLNSARIIIAGSYFISIIRPGTNYLIAIDKEKKLLIMFLSCFAINLFGNILLVKLGLKIDGIALSTVFSGILLSILIWYNVFKYSDFANRGGLSENLKLYQNFFILAIFLLGLNFIFPSLLYETSFIALGYVVVFLFSFTFLAIILSPTNSVLRQILKNTISWINDKYKMFLNI
jgi:O-antigen/teichoic acid export membrane protein